MVYYSCTVIYKLKYVFSKISINFTLFEYIFTRFLTCTLMTINKVDLKEGTIRYINERTQSKDLYFDWLKDRHIIPECIVLTAVDISDSFDPIDVAASITNV